MNMENNLENLGPDLQKEKLENEYGLVNPIIIEFGENKEKVIESLKNEMHKCRGTKESLDINHDSDHKHIQWLRENSKIFQDKDGNKKFHFQDCDGQHLENQKPKIDKRLASFLVNEFTKHPKVSGIIITSGWRCPKHNKFSVADDKSGETSPSSLHMDAEAVDFILLDKTGKPLEYQEYNNLINEIKEKTPKHDKKLKYSFFNFADWKNIARNIERNLHLTQWIQSMFFAKVYQPEEGRDTDNKHRCAYMHLDFRGVDPNKKPANYYYKRAGLI